MPSPRFLKREGICYLCRATKAASRPTSRAMRRPAKLIVEAIQAAGYKPGKDIAIALDPAASSFFDERHLRSCSSRARAARPPMR